MSTEPTIVDLLTPLAPTSSFAGADAANRPRITHQIIAGVENENLRGAGPPRRRYQIDVWADTHGAARGLADQAKVALRAGLVVGSITDNPDDYEPDTKLCRVSFDAAVWTA
jgi:hypothetical protein